MAKKGLSSKSVRSKKAETTKIDVPALGESITSATLARWLKQEGDVCAADDLLAELETDKITLEVTAPHDGVLGKLLFKEGETVEVGATLVTLEPLKEGTDGSTKTAEKRKESEVLSETQDKEVSISSQGVNDPLRTSKDDLLERLTNDASLTTHDEAAGRMQASAHEERQPMSRLRMKIAEQLKAAQNTAAILTTFNEVDMSSVMALRGRYKERFSNVHGVKLGFMSFFVKAVVSALRRFPIINAEMLDSAPSNPTEGKEILFKNYYNIGVAVGTDKGLVVPVLRHAETMDFAAIEKNILELATKARTQKLLPNDLTGGTFTITNGGVYGSLLSTPLLNPPQSAILGLHTISNRPVARDGAVVIRPIMNLALSYDHRLIDGADAVGFLKHVKELVEMPAAMMLDA